MTRRLVAALTLLLVVAPVAAQPLLRGYVRRAKESRVRPARSDQVRAIRRRLEARIATGAGARENHVARHLGGNLWAVYTRSELLPGTYDRFVLFRVDRAGRARPLASRAVYEQMVRGVEYPELVRMWQEAVSTIRTKAYRKADVRVAVDAELRFLEGEIERRVGRSSQLELPWNPALVDAVTELDRVGDGKRLVRALARGRRVERNTLDMIRRGIYRLHSLSNLPRTEFAELLEKRDIEQLESVAGVRPSDWRSLRRKNSRIARQVAEEIYGYQFANERSALVTPTNFRRKLQTILHELNHGANRIPAKRRYSKEETLAFELTAWAAEQPLGASQRRALKRRLIEDYELDGVDADRVPDVPRGVRDNWVPKFPRGEEPAYVKAFFRR